MAGGSEERAADPGKQCVEISLESQPSQMQTSDGRQVPFTRAMLTIRNACERAVTIIPQATLGQEGGTVQDVSSVLAPAVASAIAAHHMVSWDVYDIVLPAHQGTASKLHMFGYRACLNWRFDLAVGAEYRVARDSDTLTTGTYRWSLKWGIVDPGTGAVGLTIEEVSG